MSPIEVQRQGDDELVDELFDLDVRETTVVAQVTSANTASCNESCHCPTTSPAGGC